jgi:hypothetical protein
MFSDEYDTVCIIILLEFAYHLFVFKLKLQLSKVGSSSVFRRENKFLTMLVPLFELVSASAQQSRLL